VTMAHVAGLHVGSVETCSPVELKILLDGDAPQDMAFNTGRPQGFPRLNGYVLVPNEGGTVVAVIARMTMEPAPLLDSDTRDRTVVNIPVSRRRLFVTPLGTLETRRAGTTLPPYELRRGIASYPAVGDAVVLPTADQLRAIVEASGVDTRVLIGNSRLALDAPVTIDPDKLFGRHIGVFGNTGSGKSCTVAGLLRWSIEAAAKVASPVNARFIVLDPNGEYRTCFQDLVTDVDVRVYSVEPDATESRLTVPAWMWNGLEWAGALEASPGVQRPVLMQAIRQLRAAAVAGEDSETKGVSAAADGKLLIATQIRSYIEFFQGCRAEGVVAQSKFPRFKAMHENLVGLESQLAQLSQSLSEGETALREAIDAALSGSATARQTRTDYSGGKEFIKQFQDADLVGIIEALDAIRVFLPDVAIVGGISEDTPSPFDPGSLPGMVDLLSGLQAGNMQQHMAGMNLRIRTLLADTRIGPIITPEEEQTFAGWLQTIFGQSENGRGQITVLDLSLVPSARLSAISAQRGTMWRSRKCPLLR
jgi:Helicase HerA, central domain